MNPGHDLPKQPDPWRQVLEAIGNCWPPDLWCDLGVVVGCSGGADSIALLKALCDLRADGGAGFIVASHFNHGIRGREASEDADFVKRFAEKLGIRHREAAATGAVSDESTMRAARNAFLRQTAQNVGARYVAVAHSLDDNVETVLHNLMRGTGPKGLAGMPKVRSLGPDPIGQDLILVRPLLAVRRQLIREGLRSIGQVWREDSSNEDTAYRRNWIRRELLPLMQNQFPSVVDAVARAAELQSEWKSTIDTLADSWMEEHVMLTTTVQIQRDNSTPSAIIITALQNVWAQMDWPLGKMTQGHWKRLARTIGDADDDRYDLPGKIDVRAKGGKVQVCR